MAQPHGARRLALVQAGALLVVSESWRAQAGSASLPLFLAADLEAQKLAQPGPLSLARHSPLDKCTAPPAHGVRGNPGPFGLLCFGMTTNVSAGACGTVGVLLHGVLLLLHGVLGAAALAATQTCQHTARYRLTRATVPRWSLADAHGHHDELELRGAWLRAPSLVSETRYMTLSCAASATHPPAPPASSLV